MGGHGNAAAASFSRLVRTLTVVFVASFCFGMTVLSFAGSTMFGLSGGVQELHISSGLCGESTAGCADPTASLREAVALQQSRGLNCSPKAVLSDVVLFQRSDDQSVHVLTFDEALAAAAAKQGWVQRYCF